MRALLGLVLISQVTHAGVVYDFNVRSLSTPPSAPFLAHYVVQDDKVREAADDGSAVFIFKDQTIYIADNHARSVSVQRYATLEQIAARTADALRKLDAAVAAAPPDKRPTLEQLARDMREHDGRQSQPVPRDYRRTDRSESVDGHPCRIWEESEGNAKRLELCVAPVAKVPGGADLLHGMEALSRYWRGSIFALGVEFGSGQWWPGIAGLGGVPLLIREFKEGTAVSETTFTAIRSDAPSAALFTLPEGYAVQEQPLGNP